MTFDVELSDEAQLAADGIFRWLAARSPEGARRWRDAWVSALESLQTKATTFAAAPESDEFPETLRNVPFKTRRGRVYRIVYVVRGRKAFVLTVRSPGQPPLEPKDVKLPE